MQGYGPRGRVGLLAFLGVLAVGLTGCGLLESQAQPDRIVIPSADQLSTETKPSSLSASSTASRRPDSATAPAEWSYERVIKAAPRVSNADYQKGATTRDGDRAEVSGYHFSTGDRDIRCSTGTTGAQELVCASERVRGPARAPAAEDPDCRWDRDLAVLSADGVSRGGCANRSSVLFRSALIPTGSAITVDRFACLSDDSGLYCIESSSGEGFEITSSGFHTIGAADRAPERLTGPQSDNDVSSSSRVVTSR